MADTQTKCMAYISLMKLKVQVDLEVTINQNYHKSSNFPRTTEQLSVQAMHIYLKFLKSKKK